MAAGSTIHAVPVTLRVKVVNDDGRPPSSGRMKVTYNLPLRVDGDILVRTIEHTGVLRIGDDADDYGHPIVDPASGVPRMVGYLDVTVDSTDNARVAGSDGSYEVTLVIDGTRYAPYRVKAPGEPDGVVNAGPAAAGAFPPGTPVSSVTTAQLLAAIVPLQEDIAELKARPTGGGAAVTPDSIGAVPTTRKITVGTGLMGSGDLTEDLNLRIVYGTAPGTVAEGSAVAGLQDALASKTSLADVKAEVAAVVGGAPAAFDTLKEIADALAADEGATAALTTAVGNRVRVDADQGLTDTQQATARANIGAADAADTYTKAEVDAKIAGGPAATADPLVGRILAALSARRTVPCRLVAVGDSTIAGLVTSSESARVVNRVSAALQSAYPTSDTSEAPVIALGVAPKSTPGGVQVINGGISGATTASYLTDAMVTQIAALAPAVVWHQVGTNDLSGGRTAQQVQDTLTARIAALDAALSRKPVHLVVGNWPASDAPVATWPPYRAAIKAAAATNPRAIFIDPWDAFAAAGLPADTDYDLLDADGVHLNDSGHAMMADMVVQGMGITRAARSVAPPDSSGTVTPAPIGSALLRGSVQSAWDSATAKSLTVQASPDAAETWVLPIVDGDYVSPHSATGGPTWTEILADWTVGRCGVSVRLGRPANTSAQVVATSQGGSDRWYGAQVLRLKGTATKGNVAQTSMGATTTVSLTTTAADSTILLVAADYAAGSAAGIGLTGLPGAVATLTTAFGGEGAFGYRTWIGIYEKVGAPGAKTVGLTGLTGFNGVVYAVELKMT